MVIFSYHFWTFFGATFIGKAVVKVQIQACFVVLAFDKDRLAWLIQQVERLIPAIAGVLDPLFEKQRAQFHHNAAANSAASANDSAASYFSISFIWNSILIVMLLFFVKSIIESSVQERLVERDAETLAHAEASGTHVGVITRGQEKKMMEKQKQ